MVQQINFQTVFRLQDSLVQMDPTHNTDHRHLKDLASQEAHSEASDHRHKAREMVVATHLARNMERLIVAVQVYPDSQVVDLHSGVIKTETHCNLHTDRLVKDQAKTMDYLETN